MVAMNTPRRNSKSRAAGLAHIVIHNCLRKIKLMPPAALEQESPAFAASGALH